MTKLDVYSFTMTLHHLLSGRKPFAEAENALQVMFAISQSRRPDLELLPAALRPIVADGWASAVEKRPTMLEMLEVLSPAAAHLASEEQEQKQDTVLCVVCIDAPRTNVLIPCGHLCLCEEHAQATQQCPICRSHVDSQHRVF